MVMGSSDAGDVPAAVRGACRLHLRRCSENERGPAGPLRFSTGRAFAARPRPRLPRGTAIAFAANMSIGRLARGLLLALAPFLAAGCAPEVFSMTVGNPARGGNVAGAMQSYEVPPYRNDHRYEVTLSGWTPSALAFRIHLVNADRCGLPSSYSFDLVDDQGHHYPFQAAGPVHEGTAQGHLGATLHDDSIDGAFPITVGADTRFVVLQIRPRADRGCTAVDFRWDFSA
jgi:hypothetical protein